MSKIYQCDKPGYNLAIDQNDNPWKSETDETKQKVIASAGVIQFHPVPEPLTNTVFGETASDNPVTLKRIQIVTTFDREGKILGTRDATPGEIEEIIEASKAFKDCTSHKTLGVRGIWDKNERQAQLRAEVGASSPASTAVVFDKMSDPVLRLHIETKGGKYSPEATHEELVNIAVALEQE